jgi:hypothetical protein
LEEHVASIIRVEEYAMRHGAISKLPLAVELREKRKSLNSYKLFRPNCALKIGVESSSEKLISTHVTAVSQP